MDTTNALLSLSRAAPALLLALSPFPGLAEGAVQVWDCTAKAVCSTDSARENDCTSTEATPHRFEIAPVKTDAEGRGTYRMTRNGTTTVAEGRGFVGPFEWKEDDNARFTLRAAPLPDNRVAFDLMISPADQSAPMTRTSLDCEVTQ